MLSSPLVRRGFDISHATTGEEAVRMFRVYNPGLVLLDDSAGGMTALDTLQRIKQVKPDVAIILVSSRLDPDVIFRASRLGADDYLGKPVEAKELDIGRIDRIPEKAALAGRRYPDS